MGTLGTIIGVAMVFVGFALVGFGWLCAKYDSVEIRRIEPRKRLDIRV